jgi:negative regulator of flagellin synthesis FlgM
MSISQINAQSMQLRAVAALRQNSANKSASAAGAVPRQLDSVELSDAGRALAAARQSVASSAEVREDRVAAIKAAIADGSYRVDSKTLAQSMLRAGFAAAH